MKEETKNINNQGLKSYLESLYEKSIQEKDLNEITVNIQGFFITLIEIQREKDELKDKPN